MFLILLLYLLFASTFTMLKVALTYTTPIFFIAIRMLLGGLILMIYQYVKHRDLKLRLQDIGLFAQIAFFEYFAAFVLEAWSLQWVVSYKACLFFNLSPFITAIISFFLFREYLTRKKVLGLVLGFIGLLPILMAPNLEEQQAGSLLWLSFAEVALLGAVFSASYGWIMLKEALRLGYSTVFINAYTMTAAGFGALVTSLIFEHSVPVIKPPVSCYAATLPRLCAIFGANGAGLLLFAFYAIALVLIANIIAFNLYGHLLNTYSATFVSFAGFMTPFFAAILGWFFLGEAVHWQFMASMLVVCVGLLLFYQEELQELRLRG